MRAKQARNETFNSTMITLARESRGWTQIELAERASLSQVDVSRYENGMRVPSPEHIDILADALDYPITFFYHTKQPYGLGSNGLHHRKQRSLSAKTLKMFIARINMLRFFADQLLKSVDIETFHSIPQYNIIDFNGDIEHIAEMVRAAWRLPAGPVHDLVGLIENAGGIVHRTNFGTQKIDALAQWIPPSPPIILINENSPGDRLRFTLAHELGHFVMHTTPHENMEQEADIFASAFLMPARDITPDFGQPSLARMAQLKPYWRVSIAALIRRAYSLNKISDRQYRSFHEEMSKLGYRINEPSPIPLEKPTLLQELIDAHFNELQYSVKDVAQLAMLHESDFNIEYNLQGPKLHLLPPINKKPSKVV